MQRTGNEKSGLVSDWVTKTNDNGKRSKRDAREGKVTVDRREEEERGRKGMTEGLMNG